MKKTLRTLATVAALAVVTAVTAVSALPALSVAAEPQQAAQPAVGAPDAAAPAPLPEAPPVPRTFFEGVQMTFDGKAAIPGAIGINVQTSGTEPKVVWVRVLAKTTEGQIAEDVAKELTFALGPNYKIKTSGGRIRITKENKKATPISAWVAGLSIYGVAVRLEEY